MQFERKKNPPLFLVLGDKESAIGGDPTLNLMNKKEKKKKKGGAEGGWCWGLKLQCKVKKINEILKRRDYILPKIIMQKS